MRPVSLAAAVAAVLGSTSALAAPPTTPGDLRVDVYSGTAAELSWSRSTDPDGFVRGYKIRRDGKLLDTRDGLSYFIDSLTEGRASAFRSVGRSAVLPAPGPGKKKAARGVPLASP